MARLIFAGSPSVATPYLRALADEHEIVCVVTRNDAPVGRKRIVTPTPVADVADELGLHTVKTNTLKRTVLPDSDLGVVVAYGGMVPHDMLQQPTAGWVNVHFSLLPKLRGAAPIQRGMWNGDTETGFTVFSLVEELDAGPVFFQRPIPFDEGETASEALERISNDTAIELVSLVGRVISGDVTPHEQSGAVTFAPKFSREDGRINWSLDASTILKRIRAVTVEPGAFTECESIVLSVVRAGPADDVTLSPGELRIVDNRCCVGTASTAVELVTVKPAGRAEMSGADWARGLRSSVRFS